VKCLLVSDLHYSLKQFDWVTEVASSFDLVVIAGDHLDISGYVEAQVQAAVVMKYFRRIRSQTRVIVCSGNHDLDSENAAGEKFSKWISKASHSDISTDGDALEIDGTLFTVCPWWDGPHTRDDVDAQLRRDSARRNGAWIWVYHAPPDASPTSKSARGHYGDGDLSKWIELYSPQIVLTGHIHDSPFLPSGSWADKVGSTWVFNAGRQPGPVPTHVMLDTSAQSATWFSMAGAETVHLDQTLTRPIPQLEEWPDWSR
jgi:Icc-related predicted phosphoesterase